MDNADELAEEDRQFLEIGVLVVDYLRHEVVQPHKGTGILAEQVKALGLGFVGSRWKRVELGWAAYTAVGFGALKLLFEDLRFGNAASLVISLLFYGLILILLPRLTHRSRSVS